MFYSLHYLDIVEHDVADAKEWYKSQKSGLEKRFAAEIKICLEKIQNNPLGYEIKYKNVRTAFTAMFPYAIHFYIEENQPRIIIIAILHQSRNPALSQNRM